MMGGLIFAGGVLIAVIVGLFIEPLAMLVSRRMEDYERKAQRAARKRQRSA